MSALYGRHPLERKLLEGEVTRSALERATNRCGFEQYNAQFPLLRRERLRGKGGYTRAASLDLRRSTRERCSSVPIAVHLGTKPRDLYHPYRQVCFPEEHQANETPCRWSGRQERIAADGRY